MYKLEGRALLIHSRFVEVQYMLWAPPQMHAPEAMAQPHALRSAHYIYSTIGRPLPASLTDRKQSDAERLQDPVFYFGWRWCTWRRTHKFVTVEDLGFVEVSLHSCQAAFAVVVQGLQLPRHQATRIPLLGQAGHVLRRVYRDTKYVWCTESCTPLIYERSRETDDMKSLTFSTAVGRLLPRAESQPTV